MKYKTIQIGMAKGSLWSMCFVISPEGNFLVKGDAALCREYISRHYPVSIVRQERYAKRSNQSFHFGSWMAYGIRLYHKVHGLSLFPYCHISQQAIPLTARFILSSYGGEKSYTYRRLPKKWLPEWNSLIESNPGNQNCLY